MEKLTLANLLCSLRQQLLSAREQKDKVIVGELFTTFTMLREASYVTEDSKVIPILVALEDSARDSIYGDDWKSTIPSVDEINSACQA